MPPPPPPYRRLSTPTGLRHRAERVKLHEEWPSGISVCIKAIVIPATARTDHNTRGVSVRVSGTFGKINSYFSSTRKVIDKLEPFSKWASRAVLDCVSYSPTRFSSRPRVNLTHFTPSFIEQALCPRYSIPTSVLCEHKVKQRFSGSSWRHFAATHPLMPPFYHEGFFLLALLQVSRFVSALSLLCPLYPLLLL